MRHLLALTILLPTVALAADPSPPMAPASAPINIPTSNPWGSTAQTSHLDLPSNPIPPLARLRGTAARFNCAGTVQALCTEQGQRKWEDIQLPAQ